MYEVGGLGGGVATTAAAAVVLPNTGSHWVLSLVAGVTLVVGVAVTVSSAARLAAKKAHKA